MACTTAQWTEACGLTAEEFENCIHLLARMNALMISFNNFSIQNLPSEILQDEANFFHIIADAQGLSEAKKSSLLTRASRVHMGLLHFEPFRTAAVTEDILALIQDLPRDNRDQFEIIRDPSEENEQGQPPPAPAGPPLDLMQYHPTPPGYPSTGSTVYSTGKGHFPNMERSYVPGGSANIFSHGTISFPVRTVANPYTEPPVANPYTEPPATNPYTEPPVANPYTEPPVTNPYTEPPATNPYTDCYRQDTPGDPSTVTGGYFPPSRAEYSQPQYRAQNVNQGPQNDAENDDNLISDDQMSQVLRDLDM